MQDMVANSPTTIPFTAINRLSGEYLIGARVSIREISSGLWWNGIGWQEEVAYNGMTHSISGAHSYTITFTTSGDYELIFTDETQAMVPFSEIVTVYPENRLGDNDLDSTLRGEGALRGTLTIQDASNTRVADAGVWVTTDGAGANVVAGTLYTNSSGQVDFWLDDGVTYYFWAQKDGSIFNNPYEVVW